MNKITAVVIGATGLTGNLVLKELLEDNDFETVRVLTRRKIDHVHAKLQQEVIDFDNVDEYTKRFGEGDVIFSCIGTTQKKVKGDKKLYEKIDYEIPVNAAAIGVANGFKKFLIISAIGANENSSNFYLKLKGKLENRLKQFPLQSLSIFQPSVLSGNRNESRTGEKIAQTIIELLSFLLLGPLKKYHAIGVNKLAKAMVYESKQNKTGIHYYTYSEMMSMARGEKYYS